MSNYLKYPSESRIRCKPMLLT